jgi:hypothetical protein
VELYHDDTVVASVLSTGDGGTNIVNFYNDIYRERVAHDLHTLLSLYSSKRKLHNDILANIFIGNPEEAVSGYVNILMDLKDISDVAQRTYKKAPLNSYYIVILLSDKRYNEYVYGRETEVVSAPVTFKTYDKAYNYIKKWEIDVGRKITALVILAGKFDWKLTNAQYIELYTP